MTGHTILWRRLDAPGHEAARLLPAPGGWYLVGTAVFAHDRRPCRLDYRVACDAGWRTTSGRVTGWIGGDEIDLTVEVGPDGGWRLNGEACPAVAGCVDLDLNFSPSTNLLPVRRLGLAVGESGAARAAWLRFPSFALEPLDQVYHRTGEDAYRYESGGGRFAADLRVGPAGFVTHYPGGWEAEPTG
jgi:uncharacterized protein